MDWSRVRGCRRPSLDRNDPAPAGVCVASLAVGLFGLYVVWGGMGRRARLLGQMRGECHRRSCERKECVEGPVKGGRSPAKRILYRSRNAKTLKGLGLVAAFRGQAPSPSGGEDFPALGGGVRGGGATRFGKGVRVSWAAFHTERHKLAFRP